MSNLRKAAAVILPANTRGLPAANADTLEKIGDTGAITIGYRENAIPMSYADAHQPMGFAPRTFALAW